MPSKSKEMKHRHLPGHIFTCYFLCQKQLVDYTMTAMTLWPLSNYLTD
jgi:hypothetical protein